jgi:hypothetical protein
MTSTNLARADTRQILLRGLLAITTSEPPND